MRAAAEKEAAIIEAQADIEKTDLHRRAANRWINEQAQLQLNMEDIARLSLPMVNEDARPDEMEDDWIVNFFDKGSPHFRRRHAGPVGSHPSRGG